MINAPNCYTRACKHFIGVVQPNKDESIENVICKAFPNGIPDNIAYGDGLHITIIEGQIGDFVYTPDY